MGNREIFYRHLGLPSANPLGIEIVQAEGIFLNGKDGRRYIDLVSGVSVSNIGHRHPFIVKAVKEQLDRYMHLMVYGEIIQQPQTKLAQSLVKLLPEKLDAVYYVNSGSEAIEGALKLTKRVTGRSEVIAFKDAYHGGTHGALSILGSEKLKNAFRPLLPDIRHLRYNCLEDLTQISEQTACVVAECVQAEAGIILPEQDYLQKLAGRCQDTGALLIVDDIQMGFGRTGKFFSFEHFGIVPDVLCVAKAMGGGMPLGAFIASRDLMKHLTFQPELGHITTFGGHPVNCAAGIANIEVLINEKLVETAHEKGEKFKQALINHPKVKAIRHIGLMLAIDLDDKTSLDKAMDQFIASGLLIDRFLFRHHAFRIAPPLTIAHSEINLVIQLLKEGLDSI